MRTPIAFAVGATLGAAATYLLDPRRRDTTIATVKSTATDAASTAKGAAATAKDAAAKAQSKVGSSDEPDDVTLARKVESEIFRPADAPKGQVSVNAEHGVVFLRGQVDDQAWIDRLGSEAEAVDGVQAVRNLLHLPGTEAPAAPATR